MVAAWVAGYVARGGVALGFGVAGGGGCGVWGIRFVSAAILWDVLVVGVQRDYLGVGYSGGADGGCCPPGDGGAEGSVLHPLRVCTYGVGGGRAMPGVWVEVFTPTD
jgi:hypothetical protein